MGELSRAIFVHVNDRLYSLGRTFVAVVEICTIHWMLGVRVARWDVDPSAN